MSFATTQRLTTGGAKTMLAASIAKAEEYGHDPDKVHYRVELDAHGGTLVGSVACAMGIGRCKSLDGRARDY